MRQKTTKKSKLVLILAIFGVILVSSFLFGGKIINLYDKLFSQSLYTNMVLTQEQKIEDFECFYDTIKTSYPMLDADKKVMGLDFLSKKEYYLSLIKETKTNFEFYCAMSSIARELQSFHTDLVTPEYARYGKMGCYNAKDTIKARHLKGKTEYWEKYLEKEFEQYRENSLVFAYVDGSYIYDNLCSDNKYYGINDYSSIVSINNQPIIDFLSTRTTIMRYQYDHKGKRTYKTRLVFMTMTERKLMSRFGIWMVQW